MEKKMMELELEEEMDTCIRHVDAFFDVLLHGDFDERIVLEIAQAGRGLVDDMSRRIKERCGVIEKALGEIKFQRDAGSFPLYSDGGVVGVKLTIGETLRKAFEGKALTEGLCLEIKQRLFA